VLFSSLKSSKPIVCQKTGKIIGSSDQIELIIDDAGKINGIEIAKRSNFKMSKSFIYWEDVVVVCDDVIIVNQKEVS